MPRAKPENQKFHGVNRESQVVCVMFKGKLRGRKQTDETKEIDKTRLWDVENGRRRDQGQAQNY